MFIDNEAKLRIDLRALQDREDEPYYVGKLKFPGTLRFDRGLSFIAFTSKTNEEVLQIGPLDEKKQGNRMRKSIFRPTGKVHIDLSVKFDKYENPIYVGGAKCLGTIDCTEGIFVTMFTSRVGEEEIQIDRLRRDKSNDAGLMIDLYRLMDSNNNPYYVGKLQFCGTLDMHKGILFTVDLSHEDGEVLQISPLAGYIPSELRRARGSYLNDKIHIGLVEQEEKKFIGMVRCPGSIDCEKGIFFSIFNSRQNDEELQIGFLRQPQPKDNARDEDEIPESERMSLEDSGIIEQIA